MQEYTHIISFINWNGKKDNYVERYVYSELGTLYYEVNEERVYVQSIFNANNKKITLDIPNNQYINNGTEENLYNPVSYYYVDNQKNIYVNDLYVDGKLEDNIGKTFELYYNKNNPNEVSKKENPINISILIIGICFSAFTFPFVFFKQNMEKRVQKTISRQKIIGKFNKLNNDKILI